MSLVELLSFLGQHVHDMLPGEVWRSTKPSEKTLAVYRDVMPAELL